MEFQKLAKELNRMANYYHDDPKNSPMYEITESRYWGDWCSYAMDCPAEVEKVVEEWVKDHPTPIYPTFGDYLRDMANRNPTLATVPLTELLTTNMPEDIAEYYNVVPLNACGLSKYTSEWR